MDSRPVVWDHWNRRHIERDHPERQVRMSEVVEAMNDPERVEATEQRMGQIHHALLGQTAAGRLLLVVWVDHGDGRYPVHVHRAGRREARKYYR